MRRLLILLALAAGCRGAVPTPASVRNALVSRDGRTLAFLEFRSGGDRVHVGERSLTLDRL
jgi:hypothetical protein